MFSVKNNINIYTQLYVNFIMDNSNIIPIILLITLGVLLAYILYDLGHLLFTKIGKYKVISFRILNSNFYNR